MKVASLDVLVWLIIVVMVAVAKGWGKLQQSIDKDSTESKEASPVAPARRQPRSPPPVAHTAPRTARPPVGSPPPREAWRVDPEQMRRFIEQLSGKPQPSPPPPVAPPPVRKTEVARPRPAPPERPVQPPIPEPAAAPAAKPAMPATQVPAPTPRAALWAEALRDKQNIRNIIISAEIIGPPRGA